MLKKLLATVCSVVLISTLAVGCAQTDAPEAPDTPDAPEQTGPPVTDASAEVEGDPETNPLEEAGLE